MVKILERIDALVALYERSATVRILVNAMFPGLTVLVAQFAVPATEYGPVVAAGVVAAAVVGWPLSMGLNRAIRKSAEQRGGAIHPKNVQHLSDYGLCELAVQMSAKVYKLLSERHRTMPPGTVGIDWGGVDAVDEARHREEAQRMHAIGTDAEFLEQYALTVRAILRSGVARGFITDREAMRPMDLETLAHVLYDVGRGVKGFTRRPKAPASPPSSTDDPPTLPPSQASS